MTPSPSGIREVSSPDGVRAAGATGAADAVPPAGPSTTVPATPAADAPRKPRRLIPLDLSVIAVLLRGGRNGR
ncbi:hypothetical protein ACQEU6_45375 [Spirillospora sp. CA-108201]